MSLELDALWIEEHGAGLFEGHAVFPLVFGILPRMPFGSYGDQLKDRPRCLGIGGRPVLQAESKTRSGGDERRAESRRAGEWATVSRAAVDQRPASSGSVTDWTIETESLRLIMS